MNNENKETDIDPKDIEIDLSEIDFEIQETESDTAEAESIGLETDSEIFEVESEIQETGSESDDAEFDPTESEDFYNNLDVAIGLGKETETTEFLQESGDGLSEEDSLFAGVDAALAEQIEQEFGKGSEAVATEPEKPSGKIVGVLKSIPTWTKVLVSVIFAILLSVGLLFGTKGGRSLIYKAIAYIVLNQVKEEKYEKDDPTVTPDASTTSDISATPEPTPDASTTSDTNVTPTPTPDADASPTPTPIEITGSIMDDENVINVLLLGEENLYGAKYGRTDAIILVSIDKRGGNLKMVSFMRDLYVAIEGHPDNRLNSAFTSGGAGLIMETIENNFKVDIDAYVKVDFAGFEELIDQLGGLRISLTAQESEYLNTTKYISKPEERNTVAGYQNMTGSQVLGYCRVRYVPTANGIKDDYGRNYRQRVVLQAIFEKYKEKSLMELLSLMNNCLSYVTVSDNLRTVAADCLQAVIEKKMFTIDTLQMPQSNLHSNAVIQDKKVIVFYPENIEVLQEFLYGTTAE